MITGCGLLESSNSSSSDTNTSKTLTVEDNSYRYFDIEQVGGRYNYMLAPDKNGLQSVTLTNASNLVSTATPTKAESEIDLSKITTYSLATNSAKNSLAAGTQEGLYIFSLGSYGDIQSDSLYEDSSIYSGTGMNKHVASVNYDDKNIVIGLRRGRVGIAQVGSDGKITSGFTTYDRNSTLNLRFLRDIELYKNKAVIVAKNLIIADYNGTTRTLSNFTVVDDAKFNHSDVQSITVDSNTGLALLPSSSGLTVGKIEDNATFTKIKHYSDSELANRQYQSADFSSDGKKIAVGSMGKGIFVADIDSNGAISNIKDLNASTTNPNNTAIMAIRFSDDDEYVLATTQDHKITVINVSKTSGGN
jgi:hypothetical protein